MNEIEMIPTVNLRFVEREEHIPMGNDIVQVEQRKVLQQQYVSRNDSFIKGPWKTEWRDVQLVTE